MVNRACKIKSRVKLEAPKSKISQPVDLQRIKPHLADFKGIKKSLTGKPARHLNTVL
jgi:hypothetical protein